MRPIFLFALLAATVFAQQNPAPSLQNLLNNSPFGANVAAGGPQVANTPLEFRGTFVDRGERFFSLADPSTKKAEWVTLNESGHPFLVKAYDADNETVTVDFQGRSLSLKLRTAKITAAAMPVAQPPVATVPGQPPVAQPPSPASTNEAQRLAQVAEEIRRRRALRQQATQTPPAQPAPNANPPQPR